MTDADVAACLTRLLGTQEEGIAIDLLSLCLPGYDHQRIVPMRLFFLADICTIELMT